MSDCTSAIKNYMYVWCYFLPTLENCFRLQTGNWKTRHKHRPPRADFKTLTQTWHKPEHEDLGELEFILQNLCPHLLAMVDWWFSSGPEPHPLDLLPRPSTAISSSSTPTSAPISFSLAVLASPVALVSRLPALEPQIALIRFSYLLFSWSSLFETSLLWSLCFHCTCNEFFYVPIQVNCLGIFGLSTSWKTNIRNLGFYFLINPRTWCVSALQPYLVFHGLHLILYAVQKSVL